ncbi:GNAT family N-acetyltransferase [Fusibacter sp. JL216-2]|uniref:GNAT family N-acetyltransferase n=1 Tax=Fusibacter sp. JL216-2 TaxID=3071453 RepID=UPI003D34727F
MLSKIIDTELAYLKCFCETESDQASIRFKDDQLKDMHSHHFNYIPEDISDEVFVEEVKRAVTQKKSLGQSNFRILTHKDISKDLLSQLPMMAEGEKFDYYGIETKNYQAIGSREDARLELVKDQITEEHGKYVDVAANYMHMTMDFAIRRINRKFKVYMDENIPLSLYVCYDKNEPVGNCEAFINRDIMKIEDFDILEMYQRKGFGSHVLRHLLERALSQNIEFAYLVTDHNDTAKTMYEKCGFTLMGHRTELSFKIE